MAADEHQSQTVVGNFLLRKNRLVRRYAVAVHRTNNFSLFALKDFPAPDDIQREVARSAHDPGGRILWNSVKRPGLQRARQRFLDDIFSEIEVLNSEYSRQRRDHLSRLVTKKVFHQLGHAVRFLHNGFQGHRFCHTLRAHKNNKL